MSLFHPSSCGRSLIASTVILSAAHCYGFETVHIGRHDVSNPSEPFETFTIKEEVLHPKWDKDDGDNFDYDYMLIRLRGRSTYVPVDL